MNLEECYNAFGGSYTDIKKRLSNDALIQRLVIKFLDDTSYKKMNEALIAGDYEEAFRGAHTLKGVSQNLSFNRLGDSVSALTELLRGYDKGQIDEELCKSLWQQVSKDYSEVVDAVSRLA